MLRKTCAEIDLSAVQHNIRSIKECSDGASVMAVVKANAYGHGSVPVAVAALSAGAKMLAVATPDEALELRHAGISAPALVLGVCDKSSYEMLINNDISFCVADVDAILDVISCAERIQKKANIHAKIDSGMGRIGFRNKETFESFLSLAKNNFVNLEGIYTHFATADCSDKSYAYKQLSIFNEFVEIAHRYGFDPIIHCANSAASFEIPEARMDMVRGGIIVYGSYPSDEVEKSKYDIINAMTLKSTIVHLKTIDVNDSVSYGRKFIADSVRKIATLPIGYADGYSRHFSSSAYVLIKGKRAPVVGRVCMDQTMVDVTDIEGVDVGDEVVLLGSQGEEKITAEELADIAGTISYEIFTSVSPRVPRVYKGIKTKKDLRTIYKWIRDNMSSQQIDFYSKSICKQIAELPEFKTAKNIMLYYAKGSEVNMDYLLKIALFEHKNVYYPKMVLGNIVPVKYNGQFKKGKFDIMEPDSDNTAEKIDFAVVPGVCFDKNMGRTGWGKGYYDKFLAANTYKAAAAFSCQICDDCLCEKHDIFMDCIVTEEYVLYNQR